MKDVPILEQRAKEIGKTFYEEKSTWDDLPPLLDPSSPLTQAYLENLTTENRAKVGEYYLEKSYNVQAVTTVEGEDQEPIEVEVLVDVGYKVWTVIEPKWTKEDQERIDKIHQKYVAIYKGNPEYRCFYEASPVYRWPEHPFPNGHYSTERFKPRVYDPESKTPTKWREATPEECKNWDKIPKEMKRIDYCVGVLPEGEELWE